MDQRNSRPDAFEVSTEFLLRLAPVRLRETEEVEFELEAAASGQIVSLHFHGPCYRES